MRISLRRLRYKRRGRLRVHRRGRSLSARARVFIVILVLLAVITTVVSLSLSKLRPVIAVLARSEAREYVLRAINDVIENEITQGNLEYNKLVTLEKDVSGGITALITNSALINVLQTRISTGVVNHIDSLSDSKMKIPIGSALGGVLLMGRGPGVPFKIQSVTNVVTKFTNDFSSAGINQTRHKIVLDISAEISLILPGGQEKSAVNTEVAIAETVIVGVVPNVYADIWK